MKKSRYQIPDTRCQIGFTLIEILVVISIIGVLAGLVLASYTSAQRNARDTQRKNDLRQYQTALESYANENSSFYPSRTSATVLNQASSLCTDLSQYISACPEDPRSNVDPALYNYTYQSDGAGAGSATAIKWVAWTTQESTENYLVFCSNGQVGNTADLTGVPNCPL